MCTFRPSAADLELILEFGTTSLVACLAGQRLALFFRRALEAEEWSQVPHPAGWSPTSIWVLEQFEPCLAAVVVPSSLAAAAAAVPSHAASAESLMVVAAASVPIYSQSTPGCHSSTRTGTWLSSNPNFFDQNYPSCLLLCTRE